MRRTGLATKTWLVIATVASAVALVPSAASAAPGNLGPGARANLAMDAAGTAYIAWTGNESASSLRFCRLPRGATACQAITLPAPGTTSSRPFVSVDGQVVRVLSYRYGIQSPGVFLFTSGDGGATFDQGVVVGTIDPWDATVGPGGGISLVTHANGGGTLYQRVPTDGSAAPTTSAALAPSYPYLATVGLLNPTTPVAVYADGSANGQFRQCDGCTAPKDPNDAGNWSPPQDLGKAESPHLASGPSGLFLMAGNALTLGTLVVRKYQGATFGPSVPLPNGTGETPQAHLTQDPGGRLHAVWPRIDPDANRLYYATSDDGQHWAQGALTAGTETIAGLRAAAAPDHIGLVVWETGGTSSEVHFLPIGPTPPGTAPAGGQAAAYSGPTRPVTVSDRQASYTIRVPRRCVAPGQSFRVTLTWKRKKRKGNLFVKVNRSDFYLQAKVIKRDRKAPFVYTYRVRVTQPRGSTITVRARAFIKVRRGPTPKKSIRAKVKVCA